MLKIIKNIYIAMLALLVVWGCSHDEIIETPLTPQDEIVFAATSGRMTRAGETSSLAKYIDNFRIYGVKSDKLVFDNYVLWYDEETTQSNTSNWEYVGYDPVDRKLQTIKYWDFSAFPYTFWAIAGADRGEFTQIDDESGWVKKFETSVTEIGGAMPMLYYTKPTVIQRDEYEDPVTFQFVGAHSRIRFAFYETVPGYAVKNVKFHIGADATQYTDCMVNGKFNICGGLTLTYTYPDGEKPDVDLGYAITEQATHHAFGKLNYTKAASGYLAEVGGNAYLGVLSSAPTYSGASTNPGYYTSIVPYADNETPITINVDYTLVSLDKSGQEIDITNAQATVPAQFCQWKPNYSYTYLFKITDSELNPISFVAVGEIDNTTNNEQGTITTLGDYSITTHQKGDTDEEGIIYESLPYIAGRPIEISVVKGDGTEKPVLKAEGEEGTTDFVRIYHQNTVNEWVVEPSPADPTDGLETVSYDNGIAIFSPLETGTYRIEYWHKEEAQDAEMRSVKIVSIGAVLKGEGHYGTDLRDGEDEEIELK